jgi:hypothetical protein
MPDKARKPNVFSRCGALNRARPRRCVHGMALPPDTLLRSEKRDKT